MIFGQKTFISLFIWASVGITSAFYYHKDDAQNRNGITKEFEYNDTFVCQIRKEHLLCRHKPGKQGKKEVNPLIGKLDEDCKPGSVITYMPSSVDERTYITELFNKKRQAVAQGTFKFGDITLPAAADMRKLKWSDLCEQAALNHVKYCNRGVDVCCGSNKFDDYEVNYAMTDSLMPNERYSIYKYTSKRPNKDFLRDVVEHLFKYADSGFTLSKIDTTTDPFFGTNKSYLSMYLRSEISVMGLKMAVLDENTRNSKRLKIMLVFGGFSTWKDSPMYKQGEGCSKCVTSGDTCDKDTSLCVCDSNCFKNGSDPLKCWVGKPEYCKKTLRGFVAAEEAGLNPYSFEDYRKNCLNKCYGNNGSNTIETTTTSKPDFDQTTTKTIESKTTVEPEPGTGTGTDVETTTGGTGDDKGTDVETTTGGTGDDKGTDVETTTGGTGDDKGTNVETTTGGTGDDKGTGGTEDDKGSGKTGDDKGTGGTGGTGDDKRTGGTRDDKGTGAEINIGSGSGSGSGSRSTSGTESNHRRPDKTLIIDLIFSLTIQLVSWAFNA